MHSSVEHLVDVDVAGATSQRMLRLAMRVAALAFGLVLLSFMRSGPGVHADEPTLPTPAAGVSLLESLGQPVLAPVGNQIEPIVAPIVVPIGAAAVEPARDEAHESLPAPIVASVVDPAVQPLAPHTPAILTPLVQTPLVQPIVATVVAATDALTDVPASVAPVLGTTTNALDATVLGATTIDDVADATLDVPAAIRAERVGLDGVPILIDSQSSDRPTTDGSAIGAPSIDTALLAPEIDVPAVVDGWTDRSMPAPAGMPATPVVPVMPTSSAAGSLADGALRTAGHDLVVGALLASLATGGARWWLFVTSSFGWRSALVLSRLERPG